MVKSRRLDRNFDRMWSRCNLDLWPFQLKI